MESDGVRIASKAQRDPQLDLATPKTPAAHGSRGIPTPTDTRSGDPPDTAGVCLHQSLLPRASPRSYRRAPAFAGNTRAIASGPYRTTGGLNVYGSPRN